MGCGPHFPRKSSRSSVKWQSQTSSLKYLHLKSAATAIRNIAKRILSKSDGRILELYWSSKPSKFFNFFDSKEAHLSDPAVMVIVAHDLATSHSFGRLAYRVLTFSFLGSLLRLSSSKLGKQVLFWQNTAAAIILGISSKSQAIQRGKLHSGCASI